MYNKETITVSYCRKSRRKHIIRGKNVKETKKSRKDYNPNIGFIGNSEVAVSNYLFSAKEIRKAYSHAKPLAKRILDKEVRTHYLESKKLTKFLKNRDLTFSKKTDKGYKTFVVPCTTTVVPLQKSLFNDVEQAAQKLMISLRAVLQDVYGSKSLESSKFVKSLPDSVRDIFIDSIKQSSSYYPQLHHKNMKDYPFLDNVGLDLVLVEDYLQKSKNFPKLIAKNKDNELPGLPFRILEINAGSPSGASNNMNMLEGIYNQNPEILNSLGKMMPNDHFQMLGETYKSLGSSWTGINDGVQIILPPGGQNGAAPEIHQLAAYSGLLYADPNQLYQDEKGYIRLRTVSEENPVVTAIYSRVNADAALFDPKKGLIMRDPDTGKNIYLKDALKLDDKGKPSVVNDSQGNPIPLESAYSVPGAIKAVLNKKLYMGGLNRIMDNKIILATLTHYAPKFFSKKIKKAGLDPKGIKILPPQTLPPTKKSAEIIRNNPDEWVVKAPDSAGGQGIYIMKTLPKNIKEDILNKINESPSQYAYQQLVKIARIPVAVERKDGYRFANLAADIRMWVFFGGGKNAKPRISHNALVRYAPQEKGAMSSIVNTSAGGGYAPFVIVDDTNDKDAVRASELAKPKQPVNTNTALPVFVAASLVQIGRMLRETQELLNKDSATVYECYLLANALKDQLKEVLSYLNPRVIENVYKMTDLLEAKFSKDIVEEYFETLDFYKSDLVIALEKQETAIVNTQVKDLIDNMRCLNFDVISTVYSDEDRSLDFLMYNEIKSELSKISITNEETKKAFKSLTRNLLQIITLEFPKVNLSTKAKNTIKQLIDQLCIGSIERLKQSPKTQEFVEIFELDKNISGLRYETLYLGQRDSDKKIMVATQKEMRTGQLLTDSDFVSKELKDARLDWTSVLQNARLLDESEKEAYLSTKREEHLEKHPCIKRYQSLLQSTNITKDALIELLPIAPYAHFNIMQFAKERKVSIEDVFSDSLQPNRISVLSGDKLEELKLCSREHAGECFAKKKKSHGLYSKSDIYVWLRKELNPFTMIYTAGHELIHYQQIKHSMNAEKRALKDGGLSAAKFLNYYGNFLGANQRTIDSVQISMEAERKPLYGFADIAANESNINLVKELRGALKESDQSWENKLHKYGSLFNYIMPNDSGTQVKALQEVIPALENAKNIIFAQECGLEIDLDPAMSALPSANQKQVNEFRSTILTAAKKANVDWEALRIIASHQYHGVSFSRADKENENLTLKPLASTISVGDSYNQTQQ